MASLPERRGAGTLPSELLLGGTMEKYEVAVFDEKIKTKWLTVADEISYEKETIFAIQAIRANDALQKCDIQSIRNAIINVAMCGITLNPALQQAFLVPRKGKCCLDISYRGLCRIATESDSVYDIDAVPVFEGDDFYYEMGLNPILKHIPKMFDDDKEKKLRAVYAIGNLHHGIKKFVVLDREKIDRARKSSQTDKVWKEHEDEMAKKTAVKLLYKLLPQTERMSTAVSVINEHEGLNLKEEKNAQKVMERFGEKKESIEETIECPDTQQFRPKSDCNVCTKSKDCPSWTD